MNRLLPVFVLFALFFQNISISQTVDATLLEIDFTSDSGPDNFNIVGNNLYFIASNGTNGRELWVTDGSYNNTRMVKDIREGISPAFDVTNYDTYTSIGNIFYFIAQAEQHGKELYRTDGTEAGTYMIKPLNVTYKRSSYKTTMINLNNKIIYNYNTYEFGDELWVSDGTVAGTHLIKDIRPGSDGGKPQSMFLFNNLVYFVANDGVNGQELWKTDGTESGTLMVLNLNGSANGVGVQEFLQLNDKFYFSAVEGNMGSELWSSDGTAAGTQLVKEIQPGYGSGVGILEGRIVGNLLLFKATDGIHGSEIWRTDGTEAGTFMVKNINGNSGGSLDYNTPFVNFGNHMYFTADDGVHGSEVWKTDGTEAGTEMLKDISSETNSPQPTKLYATRDYLYFLIRDTQENETNIWVSDGTEGGTQELLNEDVGRFSLIEFNNNTYFSASNPLHGNELWKTNGTPNNTALFKDINAYLSAYVASPRFIDDKLVFYARNEVVGREPFITDGTIAGTKLIADINPGYYDSNNNQYHPMDFARAGNNIVFFAKTNVEGIELYKCDLDGNNASLLKNINGTTTSSIELHSFLTTFNNEAYFKADDGIHGFELWKTDGTESGTVMVKDISPDGGTSLSDPFIFKDNLYLKSFRGSSESLYRTNGTEAGTEYITNIPTIEVLATSNDYIYFAVSTVYPRSTNTNKLLRLDVNNNEELIEEWPLSEDIELGVMYKNNFYFPAGDASSGYPAIYKTDGTPYTAEKIFYSTNYHTFQDMIVCGDYLYVLKGSGNLGTKEIWRTDGTPEGSEIIISETTHPTYIGTSSCACLQESILLFNDINSAGIYSIAGNEENPRFHPINVLNENFEIEYLLDIYTNENQIIFRASAPGHGNELYSTEGSSILSTKNFQTTYDESQRSNFKAYPNPVKNSITIDNILNHSIEKLEIFNITGRKIGESKIETPQSKTSLSLENLSSGIYLIKAYSNNTTETLKVIKK